MNRWKPLAFVAFGILTAVALFVWPKDRPRAPQVVAERAPEHRLESAPTIERADAHETPIAARKGLAETRRQQPPRRISPQQASIATEVLRGFPLDQKPLAEPIAVLALNGDPEAADYARQLAQVLEQSGWATTMGPAKARYIGVMCLVDNAAQFPLHARVLTFAFQRAGIACTAANNDAPPSDRIEIVVGQQPTD